MVYVYTLYHSGADLRSLVSEHLRLAVRPGSKRNAVPSFSLSRIFYFPDWFRLTTRLAATTK